jgi:hypothetical protein
LIRETVAALVITSSASANLVNGGFESFSTWGYDFFSGTDPQSGWATTAPDNLIEVWGDGFLGVPAYEGSSFAELNANYASTLYQNVNGLGDSNQINWHFAHRGRYGIDTMRLTITDLGTDQIAGGGDDVVLLQQEFSADNTAWQVHYGSITSIGNLTTFAFEAVSAVGGNTQGNLIDYCGFGTSAVPAPGCLALLAVSVFLRKRRRL